MVKTIRTLGDAQKHGLLIVAECKGCRRMGRFLANDLCSWAGRERQIPEVPFRCRECGTREFRISCEETDRDRTPETVVWRPVKIKT